VRCDARLGIYDVQTYCTLKVMPEQWFGKKKYVNIERLKLYKKTKDQTRKLVGYKDKEAANALRKRNKEEGR
jgi:hypothetical protein